MNFRNVLENVIYLALFFVGLIAYHRIAIAPTIENAIQKETYKIEQSIDNKFKKIESLNSNIPISAQLPVFNSSGDSVCISAVKYKEILRELTNRKKRKLGLKD